MAVRLPKPFSVADSSMPSPTMVSAMTSWPSGSLMPLTPAAPRPIGRTSSSLKRIALPWLATSMISRLPSVIATLTSRSSLRRSMAMMPLDLGRENRFSAVFLTVPPLVAMKTNASSSKSRIGSTALIRSPSSSGRRFTIGLPREPRLACGTW